jgi:hypothetical protein
LLIGQEKILVLGYYSLKMPGMGETVSNVICQWVHLICAMMADQGVGHDSQISQNLM